jgi:two-component system, OmpR family, response regulator MtrA
VADTPRVLIVDDDPIILELLGTILHLNGIEFAAASDGVAGLALAQAMNPDVVLLDVMMPRKDGYEVCRELKAQPDPPKIVMVTAKTSAEDELAALAAGADDYVRKPFKPFTILRALGVGGSGQDEVAAEA